MFYVKTENGESVTKIYITTENVFTVCPECGKEFPVNLEEFDFSDGYFDLMASQLLCDECSEKHAHESVVNA